MVCTIYHHRHPGPVVDITFSTSTHHDECFWASILADARPKLKGWRSFSTVLSRALSRPGLLHSLGDVAMVVWRSQ